MKNSTRKYLIGLLPISLLLANMTAFFPEFVEKVYSCGIYRFLGQGLSTITDYFPFSVGELIVVSGLLLFLIKLIGLIKSLVKIKLERKKKIKNYLLNTLVVLSVIYFGFVVTWGLNYNRLTFGEIANYEIAPITVEELVLVCEDLITRTNTLREKVGENEKGVMKISHSKSSVFERAALGYDEASLIYSQLGGKYGQPKGVVFSKIMAYAGISGMYFPFTGEANVNTLIPDTLLPSTLAHEMAHQRGFAREDEANYIAYLTSSLHPHVDFQYSGTFLALRHAMNTLEQNDYEKYLELRGRYSDGVERDLAELRAFWDKYGGFFEKVSTEINDLYLRTNRQEDGVYSYNRMIDLLVAQYR